VGCVEIFVGKKKKKKKNQKKKKKKKTIVRGLGKEKRRGARFKVEKGGESLGKVTSKLGARTVV